jgi:hypothetical protein
MSTNAAGRGTWQWGGGACVRAPKLKNTNIFCTGFRTGFQSSDRNKYPESLLRDLETISIISTGEAPVIEGWSPHRVSVPVICVDA